MSPTHRIARLRRAAVPALLLGLLQVPAPARASWTATAAGAVVAYGCTASGTSGDAADRGDGVVRGFVRAEGGTCTTGHPTYVERSGGGWHATLSPYAGRVVAVADDGATTFLLFAATDGLRLGSRTHSGTYAHSRLLSHVRPRSGDLVAAGGRWWAVWSEPIAGGASLFQARTLAIAQVRQRITNVARVDDRPALARLSDGSVVVAWHRLDPSNGHSDVHRGRSTGGAWTFAQVTANGASRDAAIAAYGTRQLLAWTQAGVTAYADDTSGTWHRRVFSTPGTGARVTTSGGRTFVAWTSTARHAVLAERSGSVWTARDVTAGTSASSTALAVTAAVSNATVLVAEPARLTARQQSRPPLTSFRYLGTWLDLFDTDVRPAAGVADMKARGVRTIYYETARYSSTAAIDGPSRAAAWLDAAHAAGLRVVGWYLPGYSEFLDRDVDRTVAAANWVTPAGNRYDAVGVDIEYRGASSSTAEFNSGVAEHLRRVRSLLGGAYPIAAIPPAPLGMAVNPSAWAGFPWAAIGTYADVVMPMAYSSYRNDCASNPQHCAYLYTRDNTTLSARYTGLPVHVIGGVANAISLADAKDFVRGAKDGHAIGGGLYDYATTAATYWPALRPLSP